MSDPSDLSNPADLPYSTEPAHRADPSEMTSPLGLPEPAPEPTPGLAADSARAAGDLAAQPPAHEVEGATPPGYDWPTHGGYLGCLVGTLAACPIVGFIGANLWALFRLTRLALPLFALLMLISLAAVVMVGRLGWALGRRFYRYYPQPQPTWGESDAAISDTAAISDVAGVVAAQPAALDASVNDLPAHMGLTPTEGGGAV